MLSIDDVPRVIGADVAVDGADHNGRTPLMAAARNGHPPIVALLCSSTPAADVNAAMGDGSMPLHFVVTSSLIRR